MAAPNHSALLAWYGAVTAFRRSHPMLRDGNYHDVRVTFDEERSHVTIFRGRIIVACNLGDRPITMDIAGAAQVLLASEPGVRIDDGRITLPPNRSFFCHANGSDS